ncbi:unnamed protein product [Pieris macdunnoughi]|uniref:Retrovirus-related Pol polyprotein from transposon TNT 1-94 n=1 Tax=Pieris macdunnoughi TaxID=345717 RepID=A0A821Y2U1_9NEOP|nr:unnamed protein product [Pieris macdunnoughi]
MSVNYIANVPKLKGRENYDDWCFAVQNVLVLENMADKIKTQLSASASASDIESDAKAKAKLILTIDTSLYVHIKQAATAYDLWSTLKHMYDDSGYMRKISLLRNLINIRLENCESMAQYVTQIVETGQRLRGTGFSITDEWIGALMLAGLTEKYAPMIMAIEHSGIEVSADIVKTKLIDMCADDYVGTTSGSESAFIAKGRHRLKSGNTKSGHINRQSDMTQPIKVIKCYKCKKIGHFKNQCPEVKEKQVNAFSAAFFNSEFNKDDWYIDSGASTHMTSCRENLLEVRKVHDMKEIIVANNMTVPVVCAGNTQITTLVNNSQFDIKVNNILYIPNLTTNLLSVSQLIAKGNKVIFKSDVCYIHNQRNELIGIANLKNGVYKLNTVKSEKVLAAAVQITDAKQWHRRLGHINSNDLQKMKNGAVDGISFDMKADIQKINCQKTNPYTPEQNGVSERFNRTIVERSRCLLFEAKLDKSYWAEAVNTAVYLKNRSPASGLDQKTPIEVWTGHKPDLSHVRIFGSPVMMHVPKNKRFKWDKKAVKYILVGYSENVKGYRLYNPETRKICTSRDVIIMEQDTTEIEINEGQIKEQQSVEEESSMIENESESWAEDISYNEATNGPEKDKWQQAMSDELQAFEDNQAWEIVSQDEADRVVQCKWVFKKKPENNNSVRYRARLVAKGYTQQHGVDFNETYSPVLRYSTLRLLFAISVKYNFEITHLDVVTAFLNGFLTENVYMQAPANLNCPSNCVLKLKKAVYGLKQSARAWNARINDFLIDLDYKKSVSEPCLYSKKCKNEQIIIAIFVDDFFIFSNCKTMTNDLKKKLMSKFKIKDLGQIKRCLGMRVKCENNCISIDQEQFVKQILKKFYMTDCNTKDTPMECNLKLEKAECVDKQFPYPQLIGNLMYLSVLTRPDISYSVSYLSQFNNCFSSVHWHHVKRILKYLQKTKSYGLKFTKDTCNLEGFVDADWASNTVDRKSYTGFCFKLSGCVISYECRKQQTVALSSTEAEYMAIAEACKEAIYLKSLISDIIGCNYTVVIYNDNQGAKKLTENPLFHKRTKHIDVRYHFIREAVSNSLIKIEYLSTSEMPADILTKSLSAAKHNYLIKLLGIQNV